MIKLPLVLKRFLYLIFCSIVSAFVIIFAIKKDIFSLELLKTNLLFSLFSLFSLFVILFLIIMIMRYSIKLYHYYFSSEVRETKKIIKSLEDSLKEKEKECKDPNYSIIPGEASFFWSVRESITLMKVSIEME